MVEPDSTEQKGEVRPDLVRKTVVDMLKWSSIAVAEERLSTESEDECKADDVDEGQ